MPGPFKKQQAEQQRAAAAAWSQAVAAASLFTAAFGCLMASPAAQLWLCWESCSLSTCSCAELPEYCCPQMVAVWHSVSVPAA